jgi:arginase family enzyme
MLGVPLRAGSLYPGTENDAGAFRDVGLVDRLHAAGCDAIDGGDVELPSFLPHHSVPPIRNWPAPRIAWDAIALRVRETLREAGRLPLLVGCDCSVVVASVQALMASGAQNIHVLYVDGDLDASAPDPRQMHSAASCALWLLTRASPFWTGPALPPQAVTLLGPDTNRPGNEAPPAGMHMLSLADIRERGPRAAARRALAGVAADAQVILHFDIDVLAETSLAAAYFPHEAGLTLEEAAEMFAILSSDRRVRIIEISEYSSLRDEKRLLAGALADVLAGGLSRRRAAA